MPQTAAASPFGSWRLHATRFMITTGRPSSRIAFSDAWDECDHEHQVLICELVHRAMTQLPSEQRQIIYLQYWRQMSLKEIAEATGESYDSLRGKAYRARVAFLDAVQGAGGTSGDIH